MGSIILCHKKKAKRPYEVSRINRRIYTIEELCYYLCNHLYLVDYTIMNEQLCNWLEEELELVDLAAELRQNLTQHGSVEQFVVAILAHSSIYTTGELKRIQSVLEKLKNQKPIEKQKNKADDLLEGGEIKQAILIYQSILHEEYDESVEKNFYGKIYGCLGAAYGRLFLYEEAAKMYKAGFQISKEKSMLQAYIYACNRYMSKEEYKLLLQESGTYQEIDAWLQQEIYKINSQIKFVMSDDTLEKWKEEYRGMGNGE